MSGPSGTVAEFDATFTVNPGPLDHFTLALAGSQTDGVAFAGTDTLTAKDVNNNVVTGFDASANNVTLTADAPLTGTVSGIHGANVLNQAGDLSGKVVLSCSLAMNDDDTALVVAHTSSGAEELAKRIPKAHFVAAFNTVPSEVLFNVYAAKRKAVRPSLVYCGDDRKGKKVAVELIRDVGFEPVDAGPLRIARYTEPFALLVAQLAYEGKGGPQLGYRFERF